MVKIAVAVVLLAHGIGHNMGLPRIFKVSTASEPSASVCRPPSGGHLQGHRTG
jgi:hypothetical protein